MERASRGWSASSFSYVFKKWIVKIWNLTFSIRETTDVLKKYIVVVFSGLCFMVLVGESGVEDLYPGREYVQ